MQVAILTSPDMRPLEAIGPVQVFAEANRQLPPSQAYEISIVSTCGAAAPCAGLRIVPDRTIDDPLDAFETLILACGASVASQETALAWVTRAAAQARRVGSASSGTFALAAAGLLNQRRATVHWGSSDQFVGAFPHVCLEPNKLYVEDGKFATCAGVTATMDLALAYVEADHGRELALTVAQQLIMFVKRPGDDPQISAHLSAQLATKPKVRELQELVLADLTGDHSVPALARRAGMSVRNLSRYFLREVGTTPADFVVTARLEAARRMLLETNIPLKRVATRCGFGSVDALRRALIRRDGSNPSDYRRRQPPLEPDINATAAYLSFHGDLPETMAA